MFAKSWLSERSDRIMILVRNRDLFRQTFRIKESKCSILTDKAEAIEKALLSIVYNRNQLEEYIRIHPKFLYSLEPIAVNNAPKIVRLMASASTKTGVGPMAAVAGVLADLTVETMLSVGANVAVVENGGEISAVSNKPIDIAFLAGKTPLSKSVGFRLKNFPAGVATSSGVFGHALSLGEAEAVTVFSKSASIADAAATAVCNIVKGGDHNYAIKRGTNKALSIKEVSGVFIVYGEKVGMAGEIPEIIKVVKGGTQTQP